MAVDGRTSRAITGRRDRKPTRDLAAYCQWSLEETVLRYVGDATRRYTVDRLCLSGGVAQNWRVERKVATALGPQNVYISPIAGDVGQCVGNALHARACDDPGGMERIQDIMPFWGITYLATTFAKRYGCRRSMRGCSICRFSAQGCNKSCRCRIIALFEGRSEFGPRALAIEAFFCDPHNVDTVSA